jgi:hypothetical protein
MMVIYIEHVYVSELSYINCCKLQNMILVGQAVWKKYALTLKHPNFVEHTTKIP